MQPFDRHRNDDNPAMVQQPPRLHRNTPNSLKAQSTPPTRSHGAWWGQRRLQVTAAMMLLAIMGVGIIWKLDSTPRAHITNIAAADQTMTPNDLALVPPNGTSTPSSDPSVGISPSDGEPQAPSASVSGPVPTPLSATANPNSSMSMGPPPAGAHTPAPSSDAPGNQNPSQVPASKVAPLTRWQSGVAIGAPSNFGALRGEAVGVTQVWADTTAEVQSLSYIPDINGPMSIAVGGLVQGESWNKAATGAYDSRWRTAARRLAAARTNKTTYVVIAHEMNGGWTPWAVTSANVQNFKISWRRYVSILRTEFPSGYIVFSANSGTGSGNASVPAMWPGDDAVDIVGVSFYGSTNFPGSTLTQWNSYANFTKYSSPMGIKAWHQFAVSHGKPMAFPEWGLRGDDPNGSDLPVYIQQMNLFMRTHAMTPGANPAGKFVYDSYFDLPLNNQTGWLIHGGHNPKSEAMYRCLTWGSANSYATC